MQAPAGPNIVIDERSGIISGEISDTGTYAITISVPEYRNGQFLDSGSQRPIYPGIRLQSASQTQS